MSMDAAHAKMKYRGDVAAEYDKKRVDTDKWKSEQKILGEIIADFPEDYFDVDKNISKILECQNK